MASLALSPGMVIPRSESRLRRAGRRLLRQPASLLAGIVILAFVVIAIAAP